MSTIMGISSQVDPQDIFDGSLITLGIVQESLDLLTHAKNIVESAFGMPIDEIEATPGDNTADFISKAHAVKTGFTDGAETQELTKKLIAARYAKDLLPYMIYDKPRIRIIPNSKFLNTGVSYNYKPHRDTWYNGGVQEQINHWMPLCNVTKDSGFFMAPGYYNVPIDNNSEIFDLDTWDQKFRKKAVEMTTAEERPHPVPMGNISKEERFLVMIPYGDEIVFSAHHFHGSGENTTNKVRFSVDYRTIVQLDSYHYPPNIDCKSTGNLKKYMFPVV